MKVYDVQKHILCLEVLIATGEAEQGCERVSCGEEGNDEDCEDGGVEFELWVAVIYGREN